MYNSCSEIIVFMIGFLIFESNDFNKSRMLYIGVYDSAELIVIGQVSNIIKILFCK